MVNEQLVVAPIIPSFFGSTKKNLDRSCYVHRGRTNRRQRRSQPYEPRPRYCRLYVPMLDGKPTYDGEILPCAFMTSE
jgi:hypothetical protein